MADQVKHCFGCGLYHHPSLCPAIQKPLATKTPLKRKRYFNKEKSKLSKKLLAAKKKWYKQPENQPDENGEWECYLQIAPDCQRRVTRETINVEHVLSKVRHPDLRLDIKNMRPSCQPCNRMKGSRDWVDGKLV